MRKTYPFLEPMKVLDGINSALPVSSPLFPSLLDLFESMPMTLSSMSTTLLLVLDAMVVVYTYNTWNVIFGCIYTIDGFGMKVRVGSISHIKEPLLFYVYRIHT